MTYFFVDTSALAKRYLPEPGSKWVKRWIRPSAGNLIAISELARVEMFALLGRHRRLATLPVSSVNRIRGAFLRHLPLEYFVIPINSQVLVEAANLANKHSLRTLDAIQLACAIEGSVVLKRAIIFISADNALLTAAVAEGFQTDNPNLHP